jgi:germination protein YpeB
MSRRGFVRLISFLTAGLLAFALLAANYHWQNNRAKRHIEYSYLRSLENLSMSIDGIKTSLNKGLYSNSPLMLSEISGRLSTEATSAKMSLSHLPVTQLNLENTNKFLSQVGNYANSLAKRFSDGEELTQEDRDNLMKLLQHAESLSAELWTVENMVSGGHLTFNQVVRNVQHLGDGDNYPGHFSEGFANLESSFDEYPVLMYDGPFSDHIMQVSPRLLEDAALVSKEDALVTAREVSGVEKLEYASDQAGRIPAYNFTDGQTTVSITRHGGHFAYMLKYRQVGEKEITNDRAVEIAAEYLKKIGFDNMIHTYFEQNAGICTINFAGYIRPSIEFPNVTVYTDIIKIGVALDNGEIMSFDSRGFISAHHDRGLDAPTLSEYQARQKLSPFLTVQNAKLAIIPSSGQKERFTWEFLCRAENGNHVLVYINAHTGAEEQILLMRISENGTLVV